MIRLNLGSGHETRDGWTNLDLVPGPGVDIVFDLETCATTPLPLADDSVGEIRASHVLEHIDEILAMMQELHRVAAPGCVLRAMMPHGGHDDAWADPTHKRAMSINSFHYFQQPFYTFADYGYRGDWGLEEVIYTLGRATAGSASASELLSRIQRERNLVREMIVTLKAIKPVRARDRSLMSRPKIQIALAD